MSSGAWVSPVTEPGRPLLSVAIPVLNNGHLLELVLDSLTRQTMPRDQFEVIVVDDGSEPCLEPVVAPFASRLPLTYLRQEENRGRSVTRNNAVRAARGDVVLFLDADHCGHPDLLRRHWDFHAAREGRPGVLLGRSLVIDWAAIEALTHGRTPDAAMLGDYREDVRDYLFAAEHRRRDWVRSPWVYGHSDNMSVDRRSLDEVGGFDEQLLMWGGEDIELCYRLFHHHGCDPDLFVLGTDAICYVLPHFRSWPLLMAQLAENYRYIAGKHPRYDMEFFGYPGHSGTAVRRIMWFEDALDSCRRHGLGQVAALPAGYRSDLATSANLLIGLGAGTVSLGHGGATFDYDAPLGERNLHLAGVCTPFAEAEFDRVVSVDLWRYFSPEELGGFLNEALRVAGQVDFVRTGGEIDSASMLPLPFANDLDYIRATIERYFDVARTDIDGCAILTIRHEA